MKTVKMVSLAVMHIIITCMMVLTFAGDKTITNEIFHNFNLHH